MRSPLRFLLHLAPVGLLAAGCSSAQSTVFIHPLADFSLIKKVAALPLQNLTSNTSAHEWVRQILNNELLAQGLFEVVEAWEVNRVLVDHDIAAVDSLSPEDIASLAKDLGAQAVIMGTVLEFQQARFGSVTAPVIGLSLRMVDAETGLVIWSATDSVNGVGMGSRLIGADGPDLTAATSELVRGILDTLVGL